MSDISANISTWNQVLLSVSRPPLKDGTGQCPITFAPPASFPHFDEFFCVGRMDKVDKSLLRLLPEFEHWSNADFGTEVRIRDLKLLASGRMSMIRLFRRGPRCLCWYKRFHEADRLKEQNQRERMVKMVDSEFEWIKDIQVAEVMNEYVRFLHDPGNRLNHWGLNDRIYSLTWKIQDLHPERK
jgi:hypothetical protein